MFYIIRILLGCVLFCGIIAVIRKKQYGTRQYFIAACVSLLFASALCVFPVENLFLTFDSPESVYVYTKQERSEAKCVVEGDQSALVIARKPDSETNIHYFIPKKNNGWGIEIGVFSTEMITWKSYAGVDIQVEHYKNTDDYYVIVFDDLNGYVNVSDCINSAFLPVKYSGDTIRKEGVIYYTCVQNLNSEYWININGRQITLME